MCSRAATPLPLSFRPGPAGTESRWPPAIITRGASSGPVSPMTLAVSRCSDTARTTNLARRPARPSSASEPSASAGMRRPGRASVPATGRSFWSATSTAAAPARCALSALMRKKQVPRCTSAISPVRNAAKSSAAQPSPAARTCPVARPAGENCSVRTGRTRRPAAVSRGGADSR